jgi:hypothetical protein
VPGAACRGAGFGGFTNSLPTVGMAGTALQITCLSCGFIAFLKVMTAAFWTWLPS